MAEIRKNGNGWKALVATALIPMVPGALALAIAWGVVTEKVNGLDKRLKAVETKTAGIPETLGEINTHLYYIREDVSELKAQWNAR